MTEKTLPLDEHLPLFRNAFQTFVDTAENIPENLRTQSGALGEWSAREVIAHINGWMVECTRRLPRFAKGTGQAAYNIDAFNEVSVWLREGQGYEALLAENRALATKIVQFCEELKDFYRERDDRYNEWVVSLTREAKRHTEDLRQFIQENSD